MGGAVASLRVERASADMWGHFSMGMAPEATFMAKAMQVGLPQSLQLVLGVSLKMSRPFNAMVRALLT